MFPTVSETLGEVCSCGRELCLRQLGLKRRKPYLLHILWSVLILFEQTSYMYFLFYLIEQHPESLLHTVQVLYMCTLCDSTNINTIIEFVPNSL